MAALLITVAQAAALVAAGGVVVLPTETVYGLVCRPDAVDRVFEVKQRPAEKHVQLLVPDPSWLARVGEPGAAGEALAAAFWPGPLTLVVRAGPDAPPCLAAEGTIGVRMPNHPVALELLARTGPLAASSANLSGEPTPATAEAIEAVFGDAVDGYLDGGTIVGSGSTVVDLTGPHAVILREGPVSSADVTGALSGRRRGSI